MDNPTELSNRHDLSEHTNDEEPILFQLNPLGISTINPSGFTGLGLKNGYDLLDSNPNDGEYTVLSSSIISNQPFGKPTLTVQYINYPRPRSQIKNNGSSPVTGYLSMEVDKLVDGQYDWETSIIYNSPQTIPANGVLALDTIWNPLGWTPQQPGEYRAVARFQIGRREWRADYNFTVVEPPPSECSDGIDNDGDGFTDFFRVIPSGCEWANINNMDGRNSITEVELEQMLTCVTGSNRPIIPGCENLDRYQDNDVDQSDFVAFMTCYTTPIPEPPDQHCENTQDNSETGTPFECGDGIDNDNDGTIDFPQDASCVSAQDNTENWPYQCQDGRDNDNDGLMDYPDDPDCDNREDDSEQSTAAQTRVFVTSQTFDGNFNHPTGGTIATDYRCQEAANNAGLTGTFKAWISDSTTSASQRLEHNGAPYIRIDGVIVANHWADLVDGMLLAPININEFGQSTDGGHFESWTGTKYTGIASPDNCNNWTSTDQFWTGDNGTNRYTDQRWTQFDEQTCDNQLRLYCFEQN